MASQQHEADVHQVDPTELKTAEIGRKKAESQEREEENKEHKEENKEQKEENQEHKEESQTHEEESQTHEEENQKLEEDNNTPNTGPSHIDGKEITDQTERKKIEDRRKKQNRRTRCFK